MSQSTFCWFFISANFGSCRGFSGHHLDFDFTIIRVVVATHPICPHPISSILPNTRGESLAYTIPSCVHFKWCHAINSWKKLIAFYVAVEVIHHILIYYTSGENPHSWLVSWAGSIFSCYPLRKYCHPARHSARAARWRCNYDQLGNQASGNQAIAFADDTCKARWLMEEGLRPWIKQNFVVLLIYCSSV